MIGNKIKALRKQGQWNQGQLAARAGIGIATLRRIERHQTHPRIDTLQKLADALNVSLMTIIETEEWTVSRQKNCGE